MTLATSDTLADQLVAQHEAWFRDHPMGQLMPMMMLEQEDGTSAFVPCGWNSPSEREVVIAGLRLVLLAAEAVRYAIWVEAWMKRGIRDPGSYRPGDLAKDPERQEFVFTMVVDYSGHVARFQRIERGRHGGVRRLVLDPAMGGDDVMGALANLLPERATH